MLAISASWYFNWYWNRKELQTFARKIHDITNVASSFEKSHGDTAGTLDKQLTWHLLQYNKKWSNVHTCSCKSLFNQDFEDFLQCTRYSHLQLKQKCLRVLRVLLVWSSSPQHSPFPWPQVVGPHLASSSLKCERGLHPRSFWQSNSEPPQMGRTKL